jgi:hypothetical protein
MGKGGGGGNEYAMMQMQREQQEQQRQQREADAAAADRRQQAQWAREDAQTQQQTAAVTAYDQRAEEKKTAQKATTQELIDAALGTARGTAGQTLSSRGLSSDEFMPIIENEFGRVRSTIPSTSEDVSSYFTPELIDTTLNREQQNRRTNYGQKVNEYFTPSYAEGKWAGTADDQLIDSILGEASGSAQSAVERARARGQLDETGYKAAQNRLNTATTTGRSKAQALGGGVLERYKGELGGIADEARTGASSYNLGGTFDPTSYQQKAEGKYGEQKGTFEGDVRSAIGDAGQFYDVGDIIGFGAKEQGSQNTASSPLAEVLAKRETGRTARRGLGGTGTF